MRRTKNILIKLSLICVICVSVFFFTACGKDATTTGEVKQEKKVIKIGAILPLGGGDSATGNWIMNGLLLATKNNKSINVIFEDSRGEPKIGLNSVSKLINVDKVNGVISALSSVSLSILPKIERADIPLFVTLSSAPNLASRSSNLYRFFISSNIEAESLSSFLINYLKANIVGIFYSNDEGGQSVMEIFKDKYEALGGEINFEESFDLKSVDYRDLIQKFVRRENKFYVVLGHGRPLGLFVRQLKEVQPTAIIASTTPLSSPDAIAAAGESIWGCYYTTTIYKFSLDEGKKEFIKLYKKEFNSEPNFIAAYAYDLGQILSYLVNQDAFVTNRSVKEKLRSLNINGVTGTIKVDENGEIFSKVVIVQRSETGEKVIYGVI